MEFPRVTEILKPFTNFDHIPVKVLDGAAARGTSVHAICAAIAKGEWIPESMIDPELRGYVESFKLWSLANVDKFNVIEKRFAHSWLEYTGQVDFVVVNTLGQSYLVDIKTGKTPQKTFPLQMAAYKELLAQHNITVIGAVLVYLDKDGKYPKVQIINDLTEQFYVFECALTCWKYFNKGKQDGKAKEHPPASIGDNVGAKLHPKGSQIG